MENTVSINGYHGTTEELADIIFNEKSYQYKKRDNHWLGQGIYFFQNDPEQAMSWALNNVNSGEVGVVIRTTIEVDFSSFLDLDTKTGLTKFIGMYNDIKQQIDTEWNIDLKNSKPYSEIGHRFRCFVMDLLPDDIKVIKKDFKLNNVAANFKTNNLQNLGLEVLSVQICVRDTDTIVKDSIIIDNKQVKKSFKVQRSNRRRSKRKIKI